MQRQKLIEHLFVTMQKCNDFGVASAFRNKDLKVQHDISKTFEGNLSNGGIQTQYFNRYHKLLCFIHLNIPLFFLPQARNSELQQTMNRSPKINVFVKDYIAAIASHTIGLL